MGENFFGSASSLTSAPQLHPDRNNNSSQTSLSKYNFPSSPSPPDSFSCHRMKKVACFFILWPVFPQKPVFSCHRMPQWALPSILWQADGRKIILCPVGEKANFHGSPLPPLKVFPEGLPQIRGTISCHGLVRDALQGSAEYGLRIRESWVATIERSFLQAEPRKTSPNSWLFPGRAENSLYMFVSGRCWKGLCRKVEMGIFPVQQLELWRGLQLLCENIPSGPKIPSFRGQMAAEGPSQDALVKGGGMC